MNIILRARINLLWQSLMASLDQPVEPQIWQRRDRYGNTHWHAVHPVTGNSISVDSGQALRIWLDQSYYF